MSDTLVRDRRPRLDAGGDTIATFAARVLDVLVDRNRRTSSTLRVDLVSALADGMVAQDAAAIERTLGSFRRACISPVAMVELYVPAAARNLGVRWASDRMGFADVTIATARLQALVRAIGTRWGGDPVHVPGRRSVLMLVPQAEDHVLGAVVATEQLRRMGLSVCLRLGPGRAELIELLRRRSFDAVMVSCGHDTDRVDMISRLVDTVRAHAARDLPIVGGGAVAEAGGGRDLAARSGFDFVSSDLKDTVARLGFLPPPLQESPGSGDMSLSF